MSVTALSKKQQKALLFRRKQKSKKTGEAIPGDVPEQDEQEDDGIADAVVVQSAQEGESSTASSKKRKRNGEEEGAKGSAEDLTDGLKGKVKNVGKGKGKAWEEEGEDGEKSGKKSKKEIKQRFILFIGNLGFKTTVPEIQAHFREAIGHPPQVRLLTTKPTRAGQQPKSRGIAFLEIPTSDAMQAALKLHHTQIAGRRINVELTAGGGGKSEARTQKLSERNERVGVQRVRREEKEREAAIKEGAPLEHAPRVWGEAQGMAAVIAKRKVVEKPKVAVAVPSGEAESSVPKEKPIPKEKSTPKDSPAPVADKPQAQAPAVAQSSGGEAPVSTAEYQDGMKIRGGRRVKVKGKPDTNSSSARVPWQNRQGGNQRGGPSQRGGGGGRRWEPTGANAMSVGS